MILTGLTNFYQEIYPQDQFSLSILSENINEISLALIGSGNYSGSISLENGKIYDSYNRFLSCYTPNSRYSLELSFKTGLYSIWENDNLLSANKQLSNIQFKHITGIHINNFSSNDIDMEVSIFGTRPDVTFSNLQTEDLELFTGNILFSSYAGKLYNIIPSVGTIISKPTGYFTDGDYVISGRTFGDGTVINCDFDFNYGVSNQDITVDYIDPTSTTGYYNLSIGDLQYISFLNNDSLSYKHYQDCYLTANWPVDTNLDVYLQYVGRSGEQTVSGSGIGTGLYAGYVNGSGLLDSDSLTGLIQPYNIIGVGNGQLFSYATGDITYEYLVSAIGLEGGNLSTGIIVGELSGVVGPGSGRYHFNTTVTGTPNISVWDGGINSTPIGIYTGNVNYIATLSKYIEISGSGAFNGTGINNNNSGNIEKFNLITGDTYLFYQLEDNYDDIYNTFTNYRELSWYSGIFLKNPNSTYTPRGFSEYSLRIIYDREQEGFLEDYVNLIIQNEYDSYIFELKGLTL